MTKIRINPNKRTKISDGSCKVYSIGVSQLITFFDSEGNVLETSYANSSTTITNEGAIYAKSHNKFVDLTVTNIQSVEQIGLLLDETVTGDILNKAAEYTENAVSEVDYKVDLIAHNTAGLYPLPPNSLGLAWGVVDYKNKVPIGVKDDGEFNAYGNAKIHGNLSVAGADYEYLAANSLNAVWAVTDNDAKTLLATDIDGNTNVYGALNVAESQTTTVSDNNNLNAKHVITDANNKVLLALSDNGIVDNIKSLTPYVKQGNLYTVQGNNSKQITDDGSVLFAERLDNGIKFVSDKTGIASEYFYDGQNVERLYADDRAYDQVVITGQSLAIGKGDSITETNQFDNAYTFVTAPVSQGTEDTAMMTMPLREVEHETIASGFTNAFLTKGNDKPVLIAGHAFGGQLYENIKKGGVRGTYEKALSYVQYGNYLPNGTLVKAIFVVHGEADGKVSSTTYDSDLREWLDDFNADIKAINGQTDNALMFYCQTSSASGYLKPAERDTFTTPFLQLKAYENNPDLILVCPKYHLDYIDYAHADAESTRLLGEYYAKAYRKVIVEGEPWTPVKPNKITKNGASIVIDYDVMVGPLVIDTDYIATGSDNEHYGFVLKDAGSVTITDVSLSGNRQVTITTSADVPDGATLSYAFDNGTHPYTGKTQGARGNIRDSDTTKSIYTNQNLYNWSLIFKHTFGA